MTRKINIIFKSPHCELHTQSNLLCENSKLLPVCTIFEVHSQKDPDKINVNTVNKKTFQSKANRPISSQYPDGGRGALCHSMVRSKRTSLNMGWVVWWGSSGYIWTFPCGSLYGGWGLGPALGVHMCRGLWTDTTENTPFPQLEWVMNMPS